MSKVFGRIVVMTALAAGGVVLAAPAASAAPCTDTVSGTKFYVACGGVQHVGSTEVDYGVTATNMYGSTGATAGVFTNPDGIVIGDITVINGTSSGGALCVNFCVGY